MNIKVSVSLSISDLSLFRLYKVARIVFIAACMFI